MYDCGPDEISRPENGDVNLDAGTMFRAVVTFSCDQNYTLVGNKFRTCEIDGWSGSNPTCNGECFMYS